MPSILFVCTANLLRSPLAAASLQKYVDDNHVEGKWNIYSAGTWTTDGIPVPQSAVQIANQLGLEEYREHETRQVDKELVDQFDLIVAMDSGHKEALLLDFPESRSRIFLLSEIVDSVIYDIQDPSKPGVSLENLAPEIKALVYRGADKILNLANDLQTSH